MTVSSIPSTNQIRTRKYSLFGYGGPSLLLLSEDPAPVSGGDPVPATLGTLGILVDANGGTADLYVRTSTTGWQKITT